MKKLLRVFAWCAFALLLLAVAATIYSTYRGSTTWYLRMNGQVTVDGHATTGYLHANTQRTQLMLTRTDEVRPETYLVPVDRNRPIIDCGKFHPIRFLPMPIGDLNPSCSGFDNDPGTILDRAIDATLVRSPRSVEFSTASGKRIRAEW